MFDFLTDLGNWALLIYLSPLFLFVGVVGWFYWLSRRAPVGYEDETGWHRGLPEVQDQAEVFVFPSRSERKRRRAG